MTINAVRVSKTSFKKWFLYGPVDQALKTSAQCEQVTCIPLTVTVHGKEAHVELWYNAEEAKLNTGDELNSHAQTILQTAAFRDKGMTPEEALLSGEALPAIHLVKGVAVLTGLGCTDFPEYDVPCILGALVGLHPENLAHP